MKQSLEELRSKQREYDSKRDKNKRREQARLRWKKKIQSSEFVEKEKRRLADYYSSIEGRHSSVKAELKRESVPLIDLLWSFNFYREIVLDGLCHYCLGDIRSTNYGHGLDRADNILGHTCYNVVPCCKDCNDLKGVRLSYEEMMLLAPALREIRKRRASQEIQNEHVKRREQD